MLDQTLRVLQTIRYDVICMNVDYSEINTAAHMNTAYGVVKFRKMMIIDILFLKIPRYPIYRGLDNNFSRSSCFQAHLQNVDY